MEIDSTIKERLTNANQEHLLTYWSELNDEQRQILLHDINEIDFDRVTKAYDGIKQELLADTTIPNNEVLKQGDQQENIDDIMEPVPENVTGSINETSKEQLERYYQQG
jgi:UDP-N-acetylglucosamine/UDP-N-acetylgalactosamine diphosphorylase